MENGLQSQIGRFVSLLDPGYLNLTKTVRI